MTDPSIIFSNYCNLYKVFQNIRQQPCNFFILFNYHVSLSRQMTAIMRGKVRFFETGSLAERQWALIYAFVTSFKKKKINIYINKRKSDTLGSSRGRKKEHVGTIFFFCFETVLHTWRNKFSLNVSVAFQPFGHDCMRESILLSFTIKVLFIFETLNYNKHHLTFH